MAEHPIWKTAQENEALHVHASKYSWGARMAMTWGKVRRFLRGHLLPGSVKRAHGLRTDECARCGACCKLLLRCPYLTVDDDGFYSCEIHLTRPKNCRIYPIDERCVSERDVVSPSTVCGYKFKK